MKTVTKWLARIQDTNTPWTENEIIYFRKAIGSCGIKDKNERGLLLAEFERAPSFRITREHDVKGQAYVLNKSLKVNGESRKGCKFTDADLNIFKQLDHHLFIALKSYQNALGEVLVYLPIYRAVSISGDWIEYTGTTYDQIEIVGRSESRIQLRLAK